MDGLGAQLLAGAALAGDKYTRVADRRVADKLVGSAHDGGSTDKTLEAITGQCCLVMGQPVLQPDTLQRIVYGGDKTVPVDWLDKIVEGPGTHGLYRHLGRCLCGRHDDHDVQLAFPDIFEYLDAMDIGQQQVEQYDLGTSLFNGRQGALPVTT